jgi:hypothetical protein
VESLAFSSNSPATMAASDLFTRIALDPDNDGRYPDRTVLIPADHPESSALITRAIGERRPIALVFPDGSDLLARPPKDYGPAAVLVVGLLWLADFLRRRRGAPTFVPRTWVTEFHPTQ